MIIVDEEHDAAYKSDRTPRLQARDVGASAWPSWPARRSCSGRATPAVESVGRARSGDYDRIVLPSRPVGAAADRRGRRPPRGAGGRASVGSCRGALAGALAALDTAGGEQAILVINRRGTASVVLCRDCGHVQACPDCERPLVYHQAGTTLRCHHCGRATPLAVALPVVRVAADPLPRRRHGAGRARGPRHVPGAARRPARPRRRRAPRRGGAGHRCVRRGPARRPGRDEPRDQGPRHPVGHAGRRRLVGRRAQPARRARRGADLPAARPGDRPGRSRRAARATRSSRPTSPTTRRSSRPRPATGPRSTTPSSPCASGSGRRRSGGWSS